MQQPKALDTVGASQPSTSLDPGQQGMHSHPAEVKQQMKNKTEHEISEDVARGKGLITPTRKHSSEPAEVKQQKTNKTDSLAGSREGPKPSTASKGAHKTPAHVASRSSTTDVSSDATASESESRSIITQNAELHLARRSADSIRASAERKLRRTTATRKKHKGPAFNNMVQRLQEENAEKVRKLGAYCNV